MRIIEVLSAGACSRWREALGREFERPAAAARSQPATRRSLARPRQGGEAADVASVGIVVAALDRLGLFGPAASSISAAQSPASRCASARRAGHFHAAAFDADAAHAKTVAYTDPKPSGSAASCSPQCWSSSASPTRSPRRPCSASAAPRSAPPIADGQAEIGTTFISEVLPVQGVQVVGPLPGELHSANTYTAAIHAGSASRDAASALLRALTDPATRDAGAAAGLEPAF